MARICRRCEVMGCFTGNPETKAAVRKGDTCQTQMKSQAVRQNPRQMQVLMERFEALCDYLAEVGEKGAHICYSLYPFSVMHEQVQ